MQHHRIIRLVIAFAIGIFLALYSFERISDPEPGMQRAREEAVVLSAREILKSYVSPDTEIEIVDPLATDRPFLMLLDSNVQLVSLSVRDDSEKVIAAARENPKLSVTPDPRLGDDPEDHPDN
jgi:hypothetical protein